MIRFFALAMASLAACTSDGSAPLGAQCARTSDCQASLVCDEGRCRSIKNPDPFPADAPQITRVIGNGSSADRIASGLIIEGNNLATVSVVSLLNQAGETLADLAIGTAEASAITVPLASAASIITSSSTGIFTLAVGSPTGVARQDIQLLRGEVGPTGPPSNTSYTKPEADARFTKLAACAWQYTECTGLSECFTVCPSGQYVVSGGCDGAGSSTIMESFPGPSSGNYKTSTGPWPIGTLPSDAAIPVIDQWSCEVSSGTINSVYALCCPGR